MLNLFAASINLSPLSSAETIFKQRGDRKYKIIKFRFVPQLPSICINQKCSVGVWSLHIFYSLNLNGGLGASSQRFATLGIYYQNNPFLGIFQLKFCLKTFETCSLLYISVLKCSILAIILFEYLSVDPSAKRGPQIFQVG